MVVLRRAKKGDSQVLLIVNGHPTIVLIPDKTVPFLDLYMVSNFERAKRTIGPLAAFSCAD